MRSHQLAERAHTLRRDLNDIIDDDNRGFAVSCSVVNGSSRAQLLDSDPESTLRVAAVPEHELPTALVAGQPTHQHRSPGSKDTCEHDVPAFIE
jgi:hypothetical protein